MTDYQRYRRNIEGMGCALVLGVLLAYAYGLHAGRGEHHDLSNRIYRAMTPQCQAQFNSGADSVHAMHEALRGK